MIERFGEYILDQSVSVRAGPESKVGAEGWSNILAKLVPAYHISGQIMLKGTGKQYAMQFKSFEHFC